MELEEVEVFIEKDGQVRIEVRGVKGAHCLTVTHDLEKSLGGQIAVRELTSEASEAGRDQDAERQRQAGG